MIGNNPVDDMSALQLGLSGFLLTDYLENETGVDISRYPRGGFPALVEFLEAQLGGKTYFLNFPEILFTIGLARVMIIT